MGYLASSPEFRAYEENVFVAAGGEKVLPFRPADGFILVKNRQIQYPNIDWFINTDGKAELKIPAVAGDTLLIINLASFLVSGCATKEDITESSNKPKLPLFDLTWRPSRSAIVEGTVPADGETYSRSTYPDAFSAIQAGLVPVCTDAEWLADPSKRGFYTLGDGSTTFRVPDYNGKKTDAIASVVLRGDGKNAGSFGQIQQDCIRNIAGDIQFWAGQNGVVVPGGVGGAFTITGTGTNSRINSALPLGDQSSNYGVSFSAAKVVPTGTENRMTNVAGVWCIRLFNGRVLDGNIDLSELQNKITSIESNQKPVLATEWVSLRSAMWNGYGPADGQLLSRALYPSAFKAIQLGLVPVCSDADWLADPTKRGCFTLGDGSTTFRLPDYNGKYAGSLGAPVLRGDGKNAPVNGIVQGDAMRNLTGNHMHNRIDSTDPTEGVFSRSNDLGWNGWVTTGAASAPARIMYFDASRQVPVGPEFRMVNIGGCWAVKLFGYINELPLADSTRLATEISLIASRVSKLEAATAIATITLLNGWRNHGSGYNVLTVRRINGVVYLDGLIARDEAVTTPSILFTLPQGFRISGGGTSIYLATCGPAGQYIRVDITPQGDVMCSIPPAGVSPNNFLSLSGISFIAA